MNEIFWIDVQPSVPLAVVLCPRGDGSLRQSMAALRQGGIETVVSLLEVDEATWLGLAREGPTALEVGMRFHNFPIPDANVPHNVPAFRAFVSGLADRLLAGEPIGIHCRGSIGRSTVTAVCTLIHLGFAPRNALAAVAAARGCEVPDTFAQERWILDYKAIP